MKEKIQEFKDRFSDYRDLIKVQGAKYLNKRLNTFLSVARSRNHENNCQKIGVTYYELLNFIHTAIDKLEEQEKELKKAMKAKDVVHIPEEKIMITKEKGEIVISVMDKKEFNKYNKIVEKQIKEATE